MGGNLSVSAGCTGGASFRKKATDVDGLFAALTLAGQSFSDCADGVFGYGGVATDNNPSIRSVCGLGGGSWNGSNVTGRGGAVVLYLS